MKTPMQEWIEKLEEKYREYASHTGNLDWFTSVAYGIEISIKHAESLVEKEKEQMRLIYEGLLQNVGTSIKQSDLPTFEEYYNETYGGDK